LIIFVFVIVNVHRAVFSRLPAPQLSQKSDQDVERAALRTLASCAPAFRKVRRRQLNTVSIRRKHTSHTGNGRPHCTPSIDNKTHSFTFCAAYWPKRLKYCHEMRCESQMRECVYKMCKNALATWIFG